MASVGLKPNFRKIPSAIFLVSGSIRLCTAAVFMTKMCGNCNAWSRLFWEKLARAWLGVAKSPMRLQRDGGSRWLQVIGSWLRLAGNGPRIRRKRKAEKILAGGVRLNKSGDFNW
jgi:hypothetical protein